MFAIVSQLPNTIANTKHGTSITIFLWDPYGVKLFSMLFEREGTYSQLQWHLQIHLRLANKEDEKRERY